MTGHHQHQQNPPADTDPAEFWDDRYGQSDRIWSGRVNPVLAEVAGALPPGTALDLGCGEGGDAIWLAGQGWRVTAVDISAVALERLAVEATRAGVADRITAVRRDVLAEGFPAGRYDLVSAQFFQSPLVLPREKVLPPAAEAVAPGGRLLVVEHGAPPPWSGLDADDPRFASPEEIFAAIGLDPDGWETERRGESRRTATHDGHTGELVDHVVLVRRRR
ncbi:class I SAM-dependent methyltransferase [Micromonospora sp. WMMC241]|uniref:class I SAM-dependent methyltransferase n=1 Tax=Micromonospora sp. WMMC241 TaxID=3015159 RepID=UPI0022B72785|nr:class I SAM-dependent methyltransferase [Micromonospora sp. WMMC241]MCZ7437021.1 class I SAM-dependent methyltransferase [Micromonospora sp. WMMC241]